jgi:hypothetical protein
MEFLVNFGLKVDTLYLASDLKARKAMHTINTHTKFRWDLGVK